MIVFQSHSLVFHYIFTFCDLDLVQNDLSCLHLKLGDTVNVRAIYIYIFYILRIFFT